MRIAIFTETFLPKWDGIANTLCYLLNHLAKRGHESLMFAPQGGPDQYANTPVIGLPSMACPFYPDLKVVPPLFNVKQQLAAFKPDLVHLVNLASLGLVGMRQARDLGIPVVASYHTDLPGYTKHYGLGVLRDPTWAYFRWLHNQADMNLCPSHFTKAELEAHGFERVHVWGRGVDTERFHPKHRNLGWRRRLCDGDAEAQLLLYVGRLAVEKRVDWLRPLLDVLPDAHLAIVGDGPMRSDMERRFAGTKTVFTGYLEGQALAQAYASADLFVFPSANETFGNVILEAMASGIPAVAAGSGGPLDHIVHNQTGWLCDPYDPADFTALAWRYASSRTQLRKIGQAARAYAETQTWEMILDGLLGKYTQVLQKSPAIVSLHPVFNRAKQSAGLFRWR